MCNTRRLIALLPLLWLLFACRQQPAVAVAPIAEAGEAVQEATMPPPAPSATPAAVLLSPTVTKTPLPAATAAIVPGASPTHVPTVTATVTPSATPDPYAAYTIAALAARDYGGGQLEIVERLENNENFARYLVRYPSDGLTIYGFMNVPHEGSRFPVVILLHGYINPAVYEILDYTTRYADVLAEAGYFVIHPTMRGFPPSDAGDDAFRTGLAIDVLNLIAIIREQSQDPEGPLRRSDPEAIHLWGHSMGGGVVLRVATVLTEPYLRAAVLYGSMSGDERQNYEKIREWSEGRSGDFELAAPPEALQAISPLDHLQRIQVPLSIHHGAGDETVPPQWSDDLCTRLQGQDHPVECFTYNAAPHTFYGEWENLFNSRVIQFFDRY